MLDYFVDLSQMEAVMMRSVPSHSIFRIFVTAIAGGLWLGTVGDTAEKTASPRDTKEPVYRVTNVSPATAKPAETPAEPTATTASEPTAKVEHPLDPAVAIAKNSLAQIKANIQDYECTMVKREQIKGTVMDPEYMAVKIRNRQIVDGQTVVPFSVYMRFIKPDAVKGREVIYVENQNSNKLVAHESRDKIGGRLLPTVWLRTDSALAMHNNRYPITEIGIETLTRRLIERGERDRQHLDTQVEFLKGAKINKRVCTCLQVTHPEKKPGLDFNVARIFIDDELQTPIRYEAHDWSGVDGKTQLIEEYTYLDLKVNVGLSETDFDHKNPNYKF